MRNKRGFTLIELVLVLALMGIAMSIMFSPIIFSVKNFDNQNEEANVISHARATMDFLTREIRKADIDTVEVIDDKLVIDSKVYTISGGILYKGDKKVIEGIDHIRIERNSQTITIDITIEDYQLSSDINLR